MLSPTCVVPPTIGNSLSMTSDKVNQPKNVLPELIIPGLALAFTVYYLTTITEVPWISQASAVTVSGLLLLAIGAFAIRTAYRIKRGVETVSIHHALPYGAVMFKRLLLLALTIAYVVSIEALGFTLTTSIFVFLGIVILSSPQNWKVALTISLSCAAVGYIVFIYFFKTRFPQGVIENALNGLL